MTNRVSRIATAMAVTACVGMAIATPAEARHGWGGWGRHHHYDRVDAGDVLAGVAIIGVIAAIASASSQSNRRTRSSDEDYRYRNGGREDGYRDWRGSDNTPRYDNRGSSRAANDEMTAVDGCVVAAESEGGTNARVDTIRTVERDGNGYRVTGSVMRDARTSGSYASRDSFDCTWAEGQATRIDISGRD